VAADNFVRQVAFDPLRTEIPVGHPAFGVEQVDGVVGDALHEQPELLFALLERLLDFLAFGQIARDLGKSDDPAIRIDRLTT
jgi:hypothetical protein